MKAKIAQTWPHAESKVWIGKTHDCSVTDEAYDDHFAVDSVNTVGELLKSEK